VRIAAKATWMYKIAHTKGRQVARSIRICSSARRQHGLMPGAGICGLADRARG
jgi:hypothetical protein